MVILHFTLSEMTPKAKAAGLIEKFWKVTQNANLVDYGKDRAVQCAIITVGEILKSNPVSESNGIFVRQNLYWNEVLICLKSIK